MKNAVITIRTRKRRIDKALPYPISKNEKEFR